MGWPKRATPTKRPRILIVGAALRGRPTRVSLVLSFVAGARQRTLGPLSQFKSSSLNRKEINALADGMTFAMC